MAYNTNTGYGNGGNPYAHPAGYGQGSNMEMGQIGGGQTQSSGNDGRQILNECRDIESEITKLNGLIQQLKRANNSALENTSQSQDAQLEQMDAAVFADHKALAERISRLKSTPGAGDRTNARRVTLAEERLRSTYQEYQTAALEHRRKLQTQLARQYRIVNPDASEQEIRDAVERPEGGVFAQALLHGQAQSALQNTRRRHEEIQRIEEQMAELAQMFQQMNEIVLQQEPVVTHVAEQSENVVQDMSKADTHLVGAIQKARAANRKKWWCLGLTILIIIIIVAAVVGWYFSVGPGAHKQ